jgi:hypothetical protein
MRPLLLLAATGAALVLAGACAGAPRTAGGTDDAARLYRSKCTGCHRAYERRSRDAARWAGVLERMAPRARLTADERERLRAWLVAGASDAPGGGLP